MLRSVFVVLLYSSLLAAEFQCLSGEADNQPQAISCPANSGCETQITRTKQGYRIVLSCNGREKCGQVETPLGYDVCCKQNMCNRGYRDLSAGLSAKEAAEEMVRQSQRQERGDEERLPNPIPRAVVNQRNKRLSRTTTTEPSPLEPTSDAQKPVFLIQTWILLIAAIA